LNVRAHRDALHVVGASTEAGEDKSRVATALAAELKTMAIWLGLAEVMVGKKGDLTKELSRSLG
jgi:uncharacterized protein YcaQ